MFVRNLAVLFTCTFFIFCESKEIEYIENLPKCHLADNECMREVYETVLRVIAKDGIEYFNIPPLDPFHLSNVNVNVLNMVNITMVDGAVNGIKDCKFDEFSFNITEGRAHQEITCDLTLKGHYRVDGSSPLIESFLGGNTIHGDGYGKVNIEKLHLKLDFPVYAHRRRNGEIFIKCVYDFVKCDYEIGGKVGFYADKLCLGNEDVSQQITDRLNANYRFVMSAFGQPFVDKAMEFYFTLAGYFFDKIPARHMIIEDLFPYSRPSFGSTCNTREH